MVPFSQASSIEQEGLARHPAVGHGLVVCLALALAYDDIESVVTQVQALAGTLYAITEHGDGLVLEYIECFGEGEFLAGNDGLFYAAEVKFAIMSMVLYFRIGLFYIHCCVRSASPSVAKAQRVSPVLMRASAPLSEMRAVSE